MYFFLPLQVGFDGGKPSPVSTCVEIPRRLAGRAHGKVFSDAFELVDFESVGKKPYPRDQSVVNFMDRSGSCISQVHEE